MQALAKKDDPRGTVEEELSLEVISKRLALLDERLDNIDSILTAVVERVMKQPITLNITCPKCGQAMEVALMGTEKPRR